METVTSISSVPTTKSVLSRGGLSQTEGAKPAEGTTSKDAQQESPALNLGTLAKELNDAVKMFNTNISFSVDKDTGKTVIKVIDADTDEVLRQIPPEDALRIAAHMKELMGILYDDKR